LTSGPDPHRSSEARAARGGERTLCGLCLAFILTFFTLSVLTRHRGYWPVTRYCMYCFKSPGMPERRPTLFGVREGGLGEDNLLSRANFRAFFAPLIHRPDDIFHVMGVRGSVEDRLRGVLELYERRRAAGRHHGPRYVGVRLYEVKVGTSLELAYHDDPERIRMLAEYMPATTVKRGAADAVP